MPLYKTININETTTVFVWKITETYEQLYNEVKLNEKSFIRLNGMKSELHQRGFLSVRKLLEQAGYSDFDLLYDEAGKPHFNIKSLHTEPVEVSITHSHNFSAIIISDKKCGIDIELQREKIIQIANKFIDAEYDYLNKTPTQDVVRQLTVIWGAKESIFKIQNEKGISFRYHINVTPFKMSDKKGIAFLNFGSSIKKFKINFEEFEGFTLVYAFENN